jgi:hypothetical protein
MSHPPIACTLTDQELACGAVDLLPGLAGAADSVRAMPNGVRLAFAAEAGVVPRLAAVIERERQCCRFLRFRLDVSPALGPIVLVIDGPPGTAEFLAGLHPSFAAPAA